jgi:hypothetical protein
MASSMKRRVEALEAALGGDDVTLEELVHASMRQEPLDDETARRIETSRLGRLVVAAAANPAPVAPAPIPAPAVPPQSQPAFSLARMVEESFSEAAVPVVPSWEAPSTPPAIPTHSNPRAPVFDDRGDRFYRRGEVFDGGYNDEFIRPEPGMPLSTLMAQTPKQQEGLVKCSALGRRFALGNAHLGGLPAPAAQETPRPAPESQPAAPPSVRPANSGRGNCDCFSMHRGFPCANKAQLAGSSIAA